MAFLLRFCQMETGTSDGMKPKKSRISKKEQAMLLETLRESLQQSVDEKERISSELQLEQTNNNNLQTEVNLLKQKVSTLDENKERLLSTQSDLQKNNMRLNAELEALRKELDEMKTEKTQLREEKNHWLTDLGSDEKAQILFQELECVKEKKGELERDAVKSKADYTELMHKCNALEYDFKMLQKEHAKTKRDNDQLMEEKEDLRDEIDVLENQNHQMEQWLDKYKSTRNGLEGAKQQNTRLEDQIKMGRKYGQKLQKDHAELRQKYEALRQQSDSEALEKENMQLKEENEQLRKQLNAIE